MEKLLRFLFDNPIVFLLVVSWVVGGVVNAVRRAGRGASGAPSPRQQPKPPQLSPPPQRPRRTPDEIAAEMRRILGIDTVEVVPEKPIVRPVHREEVPAERPPEPLRVASRARHMDVHVAPHVGEELQRRKDPHSGMVGAQRIGELGGRAPAMARSRADSGRLVDLGDLKRAVLAAEILGPPLALRGERQPRD